MKITILLCFLIFLISYIQSYFPPERSKRILGRFRGIGANCVAALLGTVTPFCSCSSIPLFIGFTSAGLPLGVTFSFLISSPMVDLGSLLLLMGIFGWKVAVIYVVVGLIIAVIGGTLIEKMHMEKHVESFILTSGSVDIESPDLTRKTAWLCQRTDACDLQKSLHTSDGVGIGAIIHNWIPEEWVDKRSCDNNPLRNAGNADRHSDVRGHIGTIPIAEALSQGRAAWHGLSFMCVSDPSLPSIIMLRKRCQAEAAALFVVICAVGIILVGYFFNLIQPLIYRRVYTMQKHGIP